MGCSQSLWADDAEVCVRPQFVNGERETVQKQRGENERIDKLIVADKEESTHVKLLLLGAGECGKSTILKQMKSVGGVGVSWPSHVTRTYLTN